MEPWQIVLLVVCVVLAAFLAFAYFYGRKLQKRQVEQQEQLKAMEQILSALIIDKKILPLKDAGLPEVVIQQTPKYLRRSKLPVVKAKIGPRVMNLIADRSVYDILPLKKECKISLSGIYITGLKSVRGGNVPPAPKKKTMKDKIKSVFSRKKDGSKQEDNSKKKGNSK